jgi:hypothetical protein
MCKMDEMSTRCVPAWVALILLICLAGQVIHFSDKVSSLAVQAVFVEGVNDGEIDDPNTMNGEDSFILPEFSGLVRSTRSARNHCREPLVFSSLTFLPLLPPPIAN